MNLIEKIHRARVSFIYSATREPNLLLLHPVIESDLIKEYNEESVINALRLNAIDTRKWKIIKSSAKTREGLDEGFNWVLARVLNI